MCIFNSSCNNLTKIPLVMLENIVLLQKSAATHYRGMYGKTFYLNPNSCSTLFLYNTYWSSYYTVLAVSIHIIHILPHANRKWHNTFDTRCQSHCNFKLSLLIKIHKQTFKWPWTANSKIKGFMVCLLSSLVYFILSKILQNLIRSVV